MTDYIDREDALEIALEGCSSELIHHDLKRLPFVNIITCKDCRYNLRNPRKWNDDETLTYVHCEFMSPDDYCSRAEPKETDG